MRRMRESGFTLVEALVVIVVVGLVVATGFPLAQRAVVRSNVRGARSHAVSLFTTARASAQETGRTVTYSFTGNVALITATPRLIAAGGTVDTIRGTPINFRGTYGVTVSGTPSTTMTVDSRGLLSSSATTIVFTRAGVADSMTISDLGRVTR